MRQSLPPLLWETSRPGKRATFLPECDVPKSDLPRAMIRDAESSPNLPELSELDVVRHFTQLSQTNYAIDTTFYPLGSCTMKYNPKLNEAVAAMRGFAAHHPLAPVAASQGSLSVLYELQEQIKEIAGFAAASLQPAAGAQGELAGVLMIRAYHRDRGDVKRTRILIPDSAHGTNPATVTMSGFSAVEIPSDREGNVDLEALRRECDDTVAGLMITNPNTLGLFESRIEDVISAVHDCGGLVYGDGANMNAILGVVRPGDLGIDVMHFNLHKTFSTPHGGGGPGAGPVGVGEKLKPFLPGPIVTRTGGEYRFHTPEKTIGRLKAFHGNFGMLLRAFTYILVHGPAGLRAIADNAVLNANYLKKLIEKTYPVRYRRPCMHEFVATPPDAEGIHTMDIAKRLLDYGFHAPTVYFPLIVKEALMIEPTESEGRETLEKFAEALLRIAREASETPELVTSAPVTTPVSRLDEVRAARNPVLRYRA